MEWVLGEGREGGRSGEGCRRAGREERGWRWGERGMGRRRGIGGMIGKGWDGRGG